MESYLSSGSPYSYVGGATAFLPIGSKSKGKDKGELSLVLALYKRRNFLYKEK